MYTFIVNPKARSGLGLTVWNETEEILKKRQIAYRVFFTERRNHATKIVRELMDKEPGEMTLIILGGDGAVNEAVSGITDFSRVTLGYIPIGSGNDFARGMKLSTDSEKALENILDPKEILPINIGIVRFRDKNGREKERKFAVSCGIGYDAGICHQVLISKWKVWLNKIGLGKLSYPIVGIERLISLKPKPMCVTLNKKHSRFFEKVYFCAAFNTKYEGCGFKFCPDADPTDDRLDVILVEGISKIRVLAMFPVALFGYHVGMKGIHIYRCRRADVASEVPLPVHADGEPVFLHRDVSFSLEPEKLRLILS